MNVKKQKYTVIGYYEESSEIINTHVIAKDECDAVQVACKDLKADPENVVIVDILSGHHQSLLDETTLSCACDWPKED